MKTLCRILLGLAVLGLLAAVPAYATLVVGNEATYPSYTVPSGFPTTTAMVDFSAYGNGDYYTGETILSGPPRTITFFASDYSGFPPSDGYLGIASLGFGKADGNGEWWNSGMYCSGLIWDTGYMKYVFSDPVFAVGGFMNYSPDDAATNPVVVSALDINGNIIATESYDISTSIDTPDGSNQGAFIGIVSSAQNIYGFLVTNAYVGLTDLRYNGDPVPVPGAVWLLGSGLLGLVGLRRKFKK